MMFGLRSKFVKSLVLGCCCLAGIQTAFSFQTPVRKHKAPKAAVVPAPAPVVPPQPVIPPTLQKMPSTAPQVSYASGQLTVIADNSTLGDVLRAVRDRTAADLEIPGNASDRVVGHFGPGAPRDVLADLLAGSHFNYVILGTVADPTKLERVILSPKPPPAEDATAQTPANTAPAPQAAPADASNEPATEDEDENSDAQGDQVNQPPTQAPVRTPEQLLQELQRQQQQTQQQQQQQQQQPPGDSTQPAPHRQE